MVSRVAAEHLTMDIDTGVAEACARVPEMRNIVEAFAALARECEDLRIGNAGWPGAIVFDDAAFCLGEPLLAGRELSGLHPCFLDAAWKLLPTIERSFPQIAASAAAFRFALSVYPNLLAQVLEAALAEDPRALEAPADEIGIPVGALSFLVLEVLKPCLRHAADGMAHLADNDLWCRGYCPVCGAGPDFGLLKEDGDPSEFLTSKAGRLWLHCSICGHLWRFVRLVCPSCGERDAEQLEVLTARGWEHERIHACRTCHRYVIVIDLVGRTERLHPELTPIGLIPLNVLARERGYMPFARTPWNGFA